MSDQLGDRAPGRRRLLQSMAGETIGENEIVDLWVTPDHGILVERVVIVMPRPGTLQLKRFHRGNAVREPRPDNIVEQPIVHLEIGRAYIAFFGRRDAADIDLTLRT